jgi:hypothetical protein
VHSIDPDGAGPAPALDVFCEMSLDGGGWTFFAYTNGSYGARRLFEEDVGAYDPTRGDGVSPATNAYGLGGTVLAKLGATEMLVAIDGADPFTAAGRLLLRHDPFAGGFSTGPIPCSSSAFSYRLSPSDPEAPGQLICGDGSWLTMRTGSNATALIGLSAAEGAGLLWGPANATYHHAAWWYAR